MCKFAPAVCGRTRTPGWPPASPPADSSNAFGACALPSGTGCIMRKSARSSAPAIECAAIIWSRTAMRICSSGCDPVDANQSMRILQRPARAHAATFASVPRTRLYHTCMRMRGRLESGLNTHMHDGLVLKERKGYLRIERVPACACQGVSRRNIQVWVIARDSSGSHVRPCMRRPLAGHCAQAYTTPRYIIRDVGDLCQILCQADRKHLHAHEKA